MNLYAKDTTQGPQSMADLIAGLHAAGMTAAAWFLERNGRDVTDAQTERDAESDRVGLLDRAREQAAEELTDYANDVERFAAEVSDGELDARTKAEREALAKDYAKRLGELAGELRRTARDTLAAPE